MEDGRETRETERREAAEAKELFFQLSELDGAGRAARLEAHCAGRPELRARVEGLFEALGRADEVLATGAGLDPAALPAARADLRPGEALGPYRILDVAGSGGFGTVYLAEQTEPVTRRVALKVLRGGLESKPARARFDAEQQVLARMEHPGIARVFDAGTTGDGRPWFAMEYVEGAPVTAYAREHGLGVAARLQLFRAVCQAVQHAHQKGVVHRDLKPSNVLVAEVDGEPVPKVIDFGIAKAIEGPLTDLTLHSVDGQFLGTPAYMSPEQAAGETDVDTRTDVYALGVLLYELLAGAPPFELRDVPLADFLRAIAHDDPPRPSQRIAAGDPKAGVERVPSDLDWIAMRCLEKERTRRYPSANALALDVGRFLEGLPVEAAPPGALYRLKKLARRHRVAVVAGLLLFLALVAGTAGTGLGLLRANEARADLADALARVREEAERARLAELAAAAEARRATEESEVARAVNAFVTEDLLASLSPSSEPGRGRNVTVRAVLDLASARMDATGAAGGRLADKPLVEAGIRDMMGSIYSELGEPDAALRHLARAAELYAAELGPRHPDTLAVRSRVASQLRWIGRYDEAERILTETLAAQTEELGPDDPAVLTTQWRLGQLLYREGRGAESSALLEDAYGRSRATLGELSGRTLAILAAWAISAQAAGDDALAEDLFRRALDGRRRTLGDDHPDTNASWINLASFLRGQLRYDEAEGALREVYERERELLGDEHPSTLTALYNLGTLELDRGRVAEAEESLARAFEGYREVYGPDHVDTLRAMGAYARGLEARGDRDGAEVLYREALARSTATLGPDHPQTDSRRKDLTGFLFHEPDAGDELLQLLEESFESQRRSQGPEHPNTLLAMVNLSLHYSREGDVARAETLLLEAYDGLKRVRGPDHVDVLRTESDLAGLYLDEELWQKAEPLARHSVEVGARNLAPDAYDLARFRLRYGLILAETGRVEEAREQYRTAYDALIETHGPDDVLTAFAAQELADLEVTQ